MFLQTYDGLIAVDQITRIESEQATPSGTPYQTVHYRYRMEMHVTKAHPDYVAAIE